MSRAIERGLHGAVAVTILSIVGAVIFAQSEGERLTTAAYLAAGFTAVLLALWRCLPERARANVEHERSIPAIVAFWLVVLGALAASAMEAGSLGGELLVAVACAGIIAIAALFPSGLVTPLHHALAQGGRLLTVTRYAVLFGIAAWLIAATLPAVRSSASIAGFAMLVVAGILALNVLRPMRDIIGALTVAALVALAIAAATPVLAQQAAVAAYAFVALSLALLLLRQRYALSRGESIDS